MIRPFYTQSADHADALQQSDFAQANMGLWFTRFYGGNRPDGWKKKMPPIDWSIDSSSKSGFIAGTVERARWQCPEGRAQLAEFAQRQKLLCEALGGQCCELTTTSPFVTGSGLSHPVENGFTFHPTLGMPFWPASGVKGMLRAWVEVWAEWEDETQRQACVRHWFGAPKGDEGSPERDDEAGSLIFFDAVPLAWMDFRSDVLTPHLGKWYEAGGKMGLQDLASTAPADWHNPVPSHFLTVAPGARFLFGIAPRCTGHVAQDAKNRQSAVDALAALKEAQAWMGIGAKTAAGYGRME